MDLYEFVQRFKAGEINEPAIIVDAFERLVAIGHAWTDPDLKPFAQDLIHQGLINPQGVW